MKIVLHILLLFACGLLKYAVAKSIKQQNDDKRAFSFDDVIPNRFGQRGFGGSWISGTEFTYVANGNFVKHNVENNTNVTILTREFLESKGWQGASLRMSPDNTKVLVRYSNRQIFRHSAVAKYSIWFLQAPNSEFKVANGEEIQICFFAPDGKRLVHIKNNNIYSTVIGDNMPELPEIITGDGIDGTIYNGIPDWVYEEEVLGGDAASWISADGQHLAFVKFDDTNVTNAVYELYGEGDQQYPEHVQLRYPKPGTNNPTVSLNLYNFASRKRSVLEIPAKVTGEHILGTVFWIDDQTLGAIWLNRRQNFGLFVAYDVNTEQMTELLEMNQPYGWIDLSTPKCLDSICYFIDDYNNWPTLTGVNTKDKQDIKRLTSTGMNVLNFYGINNGIYYYASTPSADESFKRHTYFNDGCLTCDVKTPEGNTCSYASTTFSKDFSYYIMTCSGPDPSFTKIFKTDGNVEIYSWEENNDLREKLKGQIMPQTKIFHVPVGGNFKAVVRMILPPQIDFDGTSTKDKYPMLVRVYGGPGSVRILDTFSIGYHTYQITSKNYIYVEIDGRGTGNKGNDMMFSINNRLGSYEMDDQISVAKYLIDKYAFIDASKTAIWGWSYGGYATAMTLAKDVDMVYKCGASVAPVTSWRFYDSIYTERYMGVSANASNYFDSDVATLKHVQQIGKHQFLLAHGNSDDNVHYQQSMVLARELEMNDILFEQMSYPDEAHGLSGVQRHLYHSLDRFWDNCFKN